MEGIGEVVARIVAIVDAQITEISSRVGARGRAATETALASGLSNASETLDGTSRLERLDARPDAPWRGRMPKLAPSILSEKDPAGPTRWLSCSTGSLATRAEVAPAPSGETAALLCAAPGSPANTPAMGVELGPEITPSGQGETPHSAPAGQRTDGTCGEWVISANDRLVVHASERPARLAHVKHRRADRAGATSDGSGDLFFGLPALIHGDDHFPVSSGKGHADTPEGCVCGCEACRVHHVTTAPGCAAIQSATACTDSPDDQGTNGTCKEPGTC